jgi:hypothetical protein
VRAVEQALHGYSIGVKRPHDCSIGNRMGTQHGMGISVPYRENSLELGRVGTDCRRH